MEVFFRKTRLLVAKYIIRGEISMWKIFSIKYIMNLDADGHVDLINKFIILVIAIPFILCIFYFFDFHAMIVTFNIDLVNKILDILYDYVMIISVVFISIQTCIARKHEQGRIDLSKEHKAFEMIKNWSDSMTPERSYAKSIVEKMNVDDANKLYDKDVLFIKGKDYKMLCIMLKENLDKIENIPADDDVELKLHHIIFLRSHAISYLNTLEIVLCAWLKNSVDREIVEAEFEYLVASDKTGKIVLENFRRAAGINNYPGINNFCRYIKDKTVKSVQENCAKG